MGMLNFLTGWSNAPTFNYLFLFIAESNSGGVAFNSNALPSEVGLRTLNLWKNIENDGFYKCNIGVNNLLGHSGLPYPQTLGWHGWELELANQVDAGIFQVDNTFLVKAGQGGSLIANWAAGSSYYNTLVSRMDGAIADINSRNNLPIKIFVMYTQGINDGIASTNATTWYNATNDYMNRLKAKYADIQHFYVTNIMHKTASYIAIDNKINELGQSRQDVTIIPTNWSWDYNDNHWGYTEMKRMASVMLNYIKNY